MAEAITPRGAKRGANDPERAERIVRAALDVIVEHGVHGTTHRRIAAQAGVPLGSLTYYFDSLTDILEQAFAALVTRMSAQYRATLLAARTRAEACAAVVDLICGGSYASTDEVRALFQMYAYANDNAVVGALCRDWLSISRESLGAHFSEPASRALDALVEGWPMHQTWEGRLLDRAVVETTVTAIVERFDGP